MGETLIEQAQAAIDNGGEIPADRDELLLELETEISYAEAGFRDKSDLPKLMALRDSVAGDGRPQLDSLESAPTPAEAAHADERTLELA